MKRKIVILGLILLWGGWIDTHAGNITTLSWSQICSGKMEAAWYGSPEARKIADDVLYVQKENGGWMKNDQLHILTPVQKLQLYNKRAQHSCLDNEATTQEMRFLAKVYQKTGEEKYRKAFIKALNMIFAAEKDCGGWSQYWPLSGRGSYQDYITFNDNLMTNVMKLLKEIIDNKGDFKHIVDKVTRERCSASFRKSIEVIIKCQVNDNGTMAAWCAQHDTITFLPAEGRPHELPSISGSESADLLSFLMTIENPSQELQHTITTAVEWLDAHKIKDKALENYINANGQKDRRVVDKAGSALWGRFIQLGGETGEQIYKAFFTKLKNRNASRSYTIDGKTYTYTEYEIATRSYNPKMAYQPIYAIYAKEYPHMFYRFLYNYEDTEPETDNKGLAVFTSLTALRRTSYQFLGSWCKRIIDVEYPAWKQRLCVPASSVVAQQPVPQRPRILISTDIGGTDPDDNQSMAHFLMYCNEFDTEGLVSSPSFGSGNQDEIIRMIDLYEQQLPTLKKYAKGWAAPSYLRSITKQGRKGAAPYEGYSTPTDGSQWIVTCARKKSDRPLYVLVWGGLDDVAQALHDAPDIVPNIRVYWIGGPNKKWSINSYVYIVSNFPELWFIENNASYRGFIYEPKNHDRYNLGYYENYIKGAGLLGADFGAYYKGNPKLGDTPSLLYMMDGDPANPMRESWGGSFAPFTRSTRAVFNEPTTARDTVPIYSIMEFHVSGPIVKDMAVGTPCITLTIDKQSWDGYYLGEGKYVVKYSTYKTGTIPYTITSSKVPGFQPQKGEITIDNRWPGKAYSTDYRLGSNWYTDKQLPELYWRNYQGAMTVQKWRDEVMEDWGKRWSWLK